MYVTLNAGSEPSEALEKELTNLVRSQVGAFAAPDTFHWANSGLPKTRSGKIMRRILRKVGTASSHHRTLLLRVARTGPTREPPLPLQIATLETDALGDTSTLAEPGVVDDLIMSHPTK